MIEIKTAERAASVDKWESEREPLFSIDDATYTVPVEVPPYIALQAMERTRMEGEVAASAWLLERLIGGDAYRALITCKYIQRTDILAIQEVVRKKVFGALEDSEEGKG